MPGLNLMYTPEKVVDIARLAREPWLHYRKAGIGGSDAAAIFNASPWLSRLGLYRDKTTTLIDSAEPDNWFMLEVGHIMEPLLAEVFARRYDCKIINDTWQYRHPLFPFMLADFDRIVEMKDGHRYGLEIKTTDPSNINEWAPGVLGEGGKLPLKYEYQIRHYMAVRNVDKWFAIVGYGYSDDKTIIVEINRDLDFEEAMIEGEYDFWHNHVLKRVPPEATSISDKELKKLIAARPVVAASKKKSDLVRFKADAGAEAEKYLALKREAKMHEDTAKELKEKANAYVLGFADVMGDAQKGIIPIDGSDAYEVTFANQPTYRVDKEKMQAQYPDAYKACVTVDAEGKRPFSIKRKSVRSIKFAK